MKHHIYRLAAIFAFTVVCHNVNAENVKSIVNKTREQLYGDAFHAKVFLFIEQPRNSFSISYEQFNQAAGKHTLVKVLEPVEYTGKSFLKRDPVVLQYAPKTNKTFKVQGHLYKDSWLGSDFSTDDILNINSLYDDYTHRLLNKTRSLFIVEATKKNTAIAAVHKIILKINRNTLLPERYEYYNKNRELLKVRVFSEPEKKGNRTVMTRQVMTTIENNKPVSRTTLTYQHIEFKKSLDANIFYEESMR